MLVAIPPPLVELQRRCNQASVDRWEHFAAHRERVTALAIEAGGQTLAVLGAGNCNDLDLAALGASFREIHLVDLDRGAVSRARARQPAAVAAKVFLHAPVDLSGAFARLARFRRCPPSDQQLAALPGASVDSVLTALPARHDVVLSTCVLSQILHGCAVALGPRHDHLPVLSCALVLAHLRSLALLLAPGGTGILVTDMASVETDPSREPCDDARDRAILASELERTHRAASGTGPAFLQRVLEDDDVITPLLAAPARRVEPWLWRFGDRVTYLVHAMVFERRV
jgi:hypothetical protein